ncbi:MAG: serine/threonine-protein kinase [Planctomycetes bacterium]|nr:serine/threonine-protein kinase [Planctomycetota bacterium]
MTRRIGPHEVVRELGRGGMGVVYEVTDPALPRRLALKLILDRADPEALARFGREVELLARVRHPNVVAVHAVGRAPEGPYVLMDLVEGEPLSRLVGRLEAPRAVEVLRGLCDAVGALHAQGVLHRDLKPQNVIVRPDGTPVLLDFGLARDPAGGASLTRTGQVLGTPRYMAPEQAEGKTREPLDARTDVYGLGAILFELLSGAPPFAEVDGGPWAVLFAVGEREPRWPELDEALGAVLRRAMAKRPDDRYATARELGAALAAQTGPSGPRAGPRRRGAAAGLAAAAALAGADAVLSATAPAPPPAAAPTGEVSAPPPEAGPASASGEEASGRPTEPAPRELLQPDAEGFLVPAAWLDPSRLATAGPRDLIIWDLSTGKPTKLTVAPEGDTGAALAAAPGTGVLWLAGTGGVARLDTSLKRVAPVTGRVTALGCSPDGSRASFSVEGTLRLIEGDGGRTSDVGGYVQEVAWDPDGSRLIAALATKDGPSGLLAWRLDEAAPRPLDVPPGAYTCVAFDPRGRVLAAGLGSGQLMLLDAATGAALAELVAPEETHGGFARPLAHDAMVRAVAFSRDGELLVSVSLDLSNLDRPSQLRVWSVREERLLATQVGGRHGALAVSPDGRLLAIGSQGQVLVRELRALGGR